jgi:hypothetical protein
VQAPQTTQPFPNKQNKGYIVIEKNKHGVYSHCPEHEGCHKKSIHSEKHAFYSTRLQYRYLKRYLFKACGWGHKLLDKKRDTVISYPFNNNVHQMTNIEIEQ